MIKSISEYKKNKYKTKGKEILSKEKFLTSTKNIIRIFLKVVKDNKEYYIQILTWKLLEENEKMKIFELTAYKMEERGFFRVSREIEEELLNSYYENNLEGIKLEEDIFLRFYNFISTVNIGLEEKFKLYLENKHKLLKVNAITTLFIDTPYVLMSIEGAGDMKHLCYINLYSDNSIKTFSDIKTIDKEDIFRKFFIITNLLDKYTLTDNKELIYIDKNEFLGIKKLNNNNIIIGSIRTDGNFACCLLYAFERKNGHYCLTKNKFGLTDDMLRDIETEFLSMIVL